MTREVIARIVLAMLAASALVVGVWAAFFPRSFYDDFPGLGRVWVSVDGPYNEHLVRDVGAFELALAAVALVAIVTISRAAMVASALAFVVSGLPHFVYHLRHLDPYSTSDKVANMVTLGLGFIAPIAVLVLLRDTSKMSHPAHESGASTRR